MKLRLRLLLRLLALAVAAVVGVSLLHNGVPWLRGAGGWSVQHSLSAQPSEADEHYVDWAIEQINREKEASSGGSVAAAADLVRHVSNGDDSWLPAASRRKTEAVQNKSLPKPGFGWHSDAGASCFESYETQAIRDVLSGEVTDVLPTGGHMPDRSGVGHTVQVIVVPFAHSDPGWLQTLDEYFDRSTRRTLDLVVEKLQQYKDLKFVWSEAVFLHMWWQTLDDSAKDVVRDLVASGRLEVAHGSWVVADEAVNSLYALILNMAVGHEFVRQELGSGFAPRHGWAVDVFGYSSASARLQLEAGVEGLVLVRVHEQMKSLLRRQRALEFRWHWSDGSSGNRSSLSQSVSGTSVDDDSIFSHIEPGRLYSISQSCGPEPRACSQFDFRHVRHIDPVVNYNLTITAANIAYKAELLAEQYRLKAQQFARAADGGMPASVILVPLGDDFRYDYSDEWDEQYANYRRLFDYFAEHPQLGVQARFGTPADYFALAGSAGATRHARARQRLPCLSGDFFPYSDEPVYGDYWTGFYSTRMWLKVRGRLLERRLRTAQLLHVYSVLLSARSAGDATAAADDATDEEDEEEEEKKEAALLKAEHELALFTHHDAVTGTSKPHVAADYYKRLSAAIALADEVATSSLSSLVHRQRKGRLGRGTAEDGSGDSSRQWPTFSVVDDAGALPLVSFRDRLSSRLFINVSGKPNVDTFDDEKVLSISKDGVDITIFNPLINTVNTVVHVLIDRPQVTVSLSDVHPKSASGPPQSTSSVACQVNPMFADVDLCSPGSNFTSSARYQLAIEVRLAALDAVGLTVMPLLMTGPVAAGQQGSRGSAGSVCTLAKVTSFAADVAHANRQRACLTASSAAASASGGSDPFVQGGTLVRQAARATDGRFLVTTAAGRAFFSASSGLLLAFYPGCNGSATSEPIAVNMHMAAYRADKSGPYIFRLPTADQSPRVLEQQPTVATAVIKATGPIETTVTSTRCWSNGVGDQLALSCFTLSSRLTNVDHGVHIAVTSLLTSPQQLVLRMNTSVRTRDGAFYSDSNGLGLMRRKAYASLPVSANYYPVTAAVLIEDGSRRVTVLTGQPAGVTSLTTGQLEVMLDRHTRMDDGRGVGEGASDNRLTTTVFTVVPELTPELRKGSNGDERRATALSPVVIAALLKLQNPAMMHSSLPASGSTSYAAFPVTSHFTAQPCGGVVHLVSMRALPESGPRQRRSRGSNNGTRTVAVVLHAMVADGSADGWPSAVCRPHTSNPVWEVGVCPVRPDGGSTTVNLTALFRSRQPASIARTTLTMMHEKWAVDEPLVSLPIGNVYTFNVTFTSAPRP